MDPRGLAGNHTSWARVIAAPGPGFCACLARTLTCGQGATQRRTTTSGTSRGFSASGCVSAGFSGNVLGAAPSPLADVAVGTLGPRTGPALSSGGPNAPKRERARELQSRARVHELVRTPRVLPAPYSVLANVLYARAGFKPPGLASFRGRNGPQPPR